MTRKGEAAPAIDADRPWPGLVAFTEPFREFFYGRDEEANELFRCIRRETATLLFGRSGLGKSSLLQAGLFPRLRDSAFVPVLVRLDHDQDAPAFFDQIKAHLRQSFQAAQLISLVISENESLWEYFHRLDFSLIDRLGRPVTPVIVIDQFEEIFSLGLGSGRGREASQAFLIELADLVENRPSAALDQRLEQEPELAEKFVFDRVNYRIALSLREDYLPALESLRRRAPLLNRSRYRLLRMSGQQALDAIIKPGGHLVGDEVAPEIVRFIGRARIDDPFGLGVSASGNALDLLEVEPSLLSLICRELNERRIETGGPQISAGLLEGTRYDILHAFYERSFYGLPEGLRAFVEDELLTESGVRETMALERAKDMLKARNIAPDCLKQLVDRRLLRIEERLEVPRIEIIHDCLADVIMKSRAVRRERQATADAVARELELRRKAARNRAWTILAAGVLSVVAGAIVYGREQALFEEKSKRIELTNHIASRALRSDFRESLLLLVANLDATGRPSNWHERLTSYVHERLSGGLMSVRNNAVEALRAVLTRTPRLSKEVQAAGLDPEGRQLALLRKDALEIWTLPSGDGGEDFQEPEGRLLPAKPDEQHLKLPPAAGFVYGLGPAAFVNGHVYFWNQQGEPQDRYIWDRLLASLGQASWYRVEFISGVLQAASTENRQKARDRLIRVLRLDGSKLEADPQDFPPASDLASTEMTTPMPVFSNNPNSPELFAYLAPSKMLEMSWVLEFGAVGRDEGPNHDAVPSPKQGALARRPTLAFVANQDAALVKQNDREFEIYYDLAKISAGKTSWPREPAPTARDYYAYFNRRNGAANFPLDLSTLGGSADE